MTTRVSVDVPISRYYQEIMDKVFRNPVTVILGQTGSGKSTRVPVYLYQNGYAQGGLIGITQPRQIAAVASARYVAHRLRCRIGEEVGFQVRFNNATSGMTKIKYMTDGILLQEARSDPLFSRYSVLIFDEAHERGLNTDVCLGLAKRALASRQNLKIIVMSATVDAEKFAAFFDRAPIIRIEERMYPSTKHFLKQEGVAKVRTECQDTHGQVDEIEVVARLAARTVEYVRFRHIGDILIFMPGKEWIDRTLDRVNELGYRELRPMAIHAEMNPDEQRLIFARGEGRRVIVGTNIMETSITVGHAVHAIDSGLINEAGFDPHSGIESLRTVEHSKAGLRQREGRVGRTQNGHYWFLGSEEEYKKGREQYRRDPLEVLRPEFTRPEIQRSDLVSVVLRIIGIGVKEGQTFELLDPIPEEASQSAMKDLKALGALTANEEITPLGERLLELPLEPRIGRMILAAEELGCVAEMVKIAAALSTREIFKRPAERKKEADTAKIQFIDRRSDFLTILAVMEAYTRNGRNHNWADENFLSWVALEEIDNIARQLQETLERRGVVITNTGYHLPQDQVNLTEEEKKQSETIGKAVIVGLLKNLAVAREEYVYWQGKTPVYIHPSSALLTRKPLPKIIVSATVMETTKPFARDCQEVMPEWLEEIAPEAITKKEVVINFPLVERLIGVTFTDKTLLMQALTHSSYLNEDTSWGLGHNERLEFLGDAVLEMVVTDYLFSAFPGKPEGELTMARAGLVNIARLSQAAEDIGLQNFLLLGRGQAREKGKARTNMLGCAFEALTGAIYRDQGYETVGQFIARTLITPSLGEAVEYRDKKSILQEIVQSRLRITPTYRILEKRGSDHDPVFVAGVYFEGALIATAEGSSHKEATENAAKAALQVKGWEKSSPG